MATKECKKVTIKCLVDTKSKPDWVHFCYVPSDLWYRFKEEKVTDTMSFVDWVETWAQEDFKMGFVLSNKNDLYMLKQYIWNRAQIMYPHIFRDHTIDMQGWVRVWTCDKIRKEMLKSGRKTRDEQIAEDIGY